jgi:hypothetical protein
MLLLLKYFDKLLTPNVIGKRPQALA